MADETPRNPDRAERNQENSFSSDKFAGPPSEAPANNGRPVDKAAPNSTLAERVAAAAKRGAKKVDSADVEDKAVTAGEKKAPAKRAAKKS